MSDPYRCPDMQLLVQYTRQCNPGQADYPSKIGLLWTTKDHNPPNLSSHKQEKAEETTSTNKRRRTKGNAARAIERRRSDLDVCDSQVDLPGHTSFALSF